MGTITTTHQPELDNDELYIKAQEMSVSSAVSKFFFFFGLFLFTDPITVNQLKLITSDISNGGGKQ